MYDWIQSLSPGEYAHLEEDLKKLQEQYDKSRDMNAQEKSEYLNYLSRAHDTKVDELLDSLVGIEKLAEEDQKYIPPTSLAVTLGSEEYINQLTTDDGIIWHFENFENGEPDGIDWLVVDSKNILSQNIDYNDITAYQDKTTRLLEINKDVWWLLKPTGSDKKSGPYKLLDLKASLHGKENKTVYNDEGLLENYKHKGLAVILEQIETEVEPTRSSETGSSETGSSETGSSETGSSGSGGSSSGSGGGTTRIVNDQKKKRLLKTVCSRCLRNSMLKIEIVKEI
jgi:hypothetical protein